MKHRLIFAVLLVFSGCTYSFRGASLPPGVNSVAVQEFDDRSGFGDPNLRIDLTNLLTQKLISDNTLRVTNMSTADAAVIGVVNSVSSQPTAIQGTEQVSRWRITINVSVKFQNLKTQKVIWTKDFSDWGEYDPSQGPSNRDVGLKQAEDKLSEDILLALVTNW
ncbi:MAG: LPS assembly lipoprotein LptE [Bacteroidetes bacterium]|nr:LPS assembly lipoprotein LptE [Bacteroidota bacterium]MCL5737081.1 LPS assembly lipoprotein LptE [Bacteroidota bacterium]